MGKWYGNNENYCDRVTMATRNEPKVMPFVAIYNKSVDVLFPAQPYREADVIREYTE